MKTNRTPQILIDAQANWPEDEASLTLNSLRERLTIWSTGDDADNADYARELFGKDVRHMRRVFMMEADGAELVARYDAALLAGLAASQPLCAGVTLPAPMPRFEDFKAAHAYAFSDLVSYGDDDEVTAARLAPFVNASGPTALVTWIQRREMLNGFLAASSAVDAMHDALCQLAK